MTKGKKDQEIITEIGNTEMIVKEETIETDTKGEEFQLSMKMIGEKEE